MFFVLIDKLNDMFLSIIRQPQQASPQLLVRTPGSYRKLCLPIFFQLSDIRFLDFLTVQQSCSWHLFRIDAEHQVSLAG